MTRVHGPGAATPGRIALLVVGLLIALGCAAPRPSESPADPSTSASPKVVNLWLTEAEIAKAVAFRTSVGLRADQSWIVSVATGPDAQAGVRAFGVPLTGPERDELLRRAVSTDEVTTAMQDYATKHEDAWAGVYVENGTIVGRFTSDLADHEAALNTILGRAARWRLEPARWTLLEMRALQSRIAHDTWHTAQGFDLLDLGASIRTNVVQFHVSSADPTAAQRIAEHYAAGEMLVVTSDGTGVTRLPTGGLAGEVVDSDGKPVEGLDVEFRGDIPGSGPHGDIGQETDAQGRFRFDEITATGYELRLLSHTAPDGTYLEGAARTLVRSVRVVVGPGASTFVEVVIDTTQIVRP